VKPVALVTGEVSPYRREPFRLLDEREGVEVLAWRELGQLEPARRIAGGRYRAVICGLGGRVALPATYAAGAGAVRAVGVDLGASADGGAHAVVPPHAMALPAR
jgi:hypothetical protein